MPSTPSGLACPKAKPFDSPIQAPWVLTQTETVPHHTAADSFIALGMGNHIYIDAVFSVTKGQRIMNEAERKQTPGRAE